MNGFLSTLLGFASATSLFVVFLALYVGQARSLISSFGSAIVIAGVLFILSLFFDRRDARRHHRPPTEVLPSRLGFMSFVFVLYLLSAVALFMVTFVYAVLRLPAGDDWGTAWQRLLFFAVAFAVGWQIQSLVVRVGHRLFAGRVYDDWLESLGKPMTATEACQEYLSQISNIDLLIMLTLGLLVFAGAMDWIAPVADWRAAGPKGRKLRWLIRWLLDHPNTLDLFAATICVASSSLIGWRIIRWNAKRQSCGTERE